MIFFNNKEMSKRKAMLIMQAEGHSPSVIAITLAHAPFAGKRPRPTPHTIGGSWLPSVEAPVPPAPSTDAQMALARIGPLSAPGKPLAVENAHLRGPIGDDFEANNDIHAANLLRDPGKPVVVINGRPFSLDPVDRESLVVIPGSSGAIIQLSSGGKTVSVANAGSTRSKLRQTLRDLHYARIHYVGNPLPEHAYKTFVLSPVQVRSLAMALKKGFTSDFLPREQPYRRWPTAVADVKQPALEATRAREAGLELPFLRPEALQWLPPIDQDKVIHYDYRHQAVDWPSKKWLLKEKGAIHHEWPVEANGRPRYRLHPDDVNHSLRSQRFLEIGQIHGGIWSSNNEMAFQNQASLDRARNQLLSTPD